MPTGSSYRFLLTAEVLGFVLTQRGTEQRRLGDLFYFLASQPFLPGDYQERDEDGRMMEVRQFQKFLVTYWSDHAVKEVRVVRVERL